ncbi:hypothetical protein WSM22_33680 [Cytophagales bacterium WSM2-2]|nr:hypothetical protein WSM22_33680 [Cytophagales bacterium WSM2-2]
MSVKLLQKQYFGSGLLEAEFDFFSLNLSRYTPNEAIEKHHHENSYVSLLLRGHYEEKSNSSAVSLSKNNVIFRPSLYDHTNTFSNKGGLCFNLEIKNNFEKILDYDIRLPRTATFFNHATIALPLYELFSLLINQDDSDLVYEKAIECLSSLTAEAKISSSLPWMNKLLNILDNETNHHHTIHSLSERVHVHPIYLANAFKKKTRLTIGEYQTKAKLKAACGLLLNSNKAVHEIAAASGFHDSTHFIRSFKHFFKSTPHQVRLLARKSI